MEWIFTQWLGLSLALAALAGVVVVVIALVRQRQDLANMAQAVTDAAQASAKAVATQAAKREAESATRALTKPVLETQTQLDKQFSDLQAQQATLNESFSALQAQQQVLEELLSALQQQQTALEERQANVEEQTPESRFYQRAAKLVEKGASVEDLMKDCEIPRNEAELLISLHRRD